MNDVDDATEGRVRPTLVWDWPLRIWHWLFAIGVSASLVTGLIGDVSLMDWHLWLGYSALALLLFRLGWALWGGRYARLDTFRTSPGRILAHFRGRGEAGPPTAEPRTMGPRTAPGAALAILLFLAVMVQAAAGLFTTDDIFTEGPLVRHASSDTVDLMSAVHHRAYWVVLALIAVHLLAHLVYALRRDPTPLSMFTGRKPVALPPTRHRPVRALVTALVCAGAVWWGLSLA
ncbi:MAG TPA: cytochrome b/b6 domain-containing protein [Pseudomonadales bacterium]